MDRLLFNVLVIRILLRLKEIVQGVIVMLIIMDRAVRSVRSVKLVIFKGV